MNRTLPGVDPLDCFRANAFVVVYAAAPKWIQSPLIGTAHVQNDHLTEARWGREGDCLRPDERFGSLDALVGQIAIDKARAGRR